MITPIRKKAAMLSIKNMSFKKKLLLYMATTTATALMLCGIAVITGQWIESRQQLPRDLSIEADVIGANTSAALSFDDPKSAEETLRSLKADKNIVFALVRSRDGKEFATFRRPDAEDATEEPVAPGDHRFAGDRLHLCRLIVLDGEWIGTIYLQYDLTQFYKDLMRTATILALGMLIALAGAALVSTGMQRVLTRPITELADTAQTVAEKNDYSVRAVKHSCDELGMLTDTFNDMLTQIEQRDIALQESRHTLEWLVEERTNALQTSEAKLRALIGDIDAIVWEADIETFQFTFVSERAERILGYPAQQWLDDSDFWPNHLHPDDRDKTVALCKKSTALGKDHELSYRMVSAKGQDVWLRDLVRVMTDKSGKTKLRGLMVDVTEQKRVESELSGAMRRAEAANRAKSEFLANMSHEIRTPLTAIMGYADIILEDDDINSAPPERVDAAQTIQRNSTHLLKLVNDILDLSKIEAGELHTECIEYSPCAIVADVLSLMRVRAQEAGLALSVDYVGRLPETIETDPTRLRQILINLVGNAIKFTQQGSVHIAVRLVDEGAILPQLCFEIADTGVGISNDQMAHIFDPFTQADTSTTRKFGGTGLGLAISRQMARLLGGDIACESELGKGSTFRITVAAGALEGIKMLDPRGEAVTSGDSLRDKASGNVDLADSNIQNCRILLVEDGPDNQRLISFILKKAGARVVVANNGKIGVDTVARAAGAGEPFNLILMDMQMPVMDGYEATRELRERGFNAPIIALTAHAMSGDREKCLAAGCNDYATKPINRASLIALIKSHLLKGDTNVPTDKNMLAPVVSELTSPDMIDLVEMFVEELPDKVAAIQQATRNQDFAELAKLAHQLKGSAGGYGFPSITDAARAVETSAKTDEQVEKIAASVQLLADLCGRARAIAASV